MDDTIPLRQWSATRHEHEALHAAARAEDLRAAMAHLRAHGQRMTEPRRAVLHALAGSADHLTADEVVDLLAESDVHRATVYRTLDLLAASGVVSQRRTASGATGYHLAATGAGRAHLHGHCVDCGAVVMLPLGAFRSLTNQLRATTGFVLAPDRSALAGRCESCAAAR
ncbi:Fur family transcriptional regulator [Microbacterium lushaniae]|uniref:Transcriptional repressor n=1 Tax=Microbacterium lushaniae TaxID=2614639 RepID=A0A5J6L6S9_9MICO|nr:transcriptional repressor [Microbacterium lushaniae]QEW04130.1 transcriptional repressor [Microbacterium lushaniae]